LAGELALALDGEQAVLQGDVDVVGVDARHLDGNHVGVLALGDVERRRPHAPTALTLASSAEDLVHLVLDRQQVLEGIPTRHTHDGPTSSSPEGVHAPFCWSWSP